MFTIDRNKSLVNFTGSDVLRLRKPNHASHLTVGGSWYQRVHCLNLSHTQRGKVCGTNCTRQLSTLYWTHHMTHQLKLNNCTGCMRKRSLLSRCPTYLMRSTGQKASRYAVFSTPLLPSPLWPKYLPQHPVIEHSQSTFLNMTDQVSHPHKRIGNISVRYMLT